MKAVMYGAGNIGRGFIGQLLSESGYEISFVDVNMTVIDRLNLDREYPLYLTAEDEYDMHMIKNVRGIDGNDIGAVAEAIAEADIMATAVGVNILKFIAKNIAEGVKLRMKKANGVPLDIIVCENMIGADAYLASLVKSYMNEEEQAYFDKYIGLVEPSVGRMVPVTPAEFSEKNPLSVCAEPYLELPVDKDAFKGKIPDIMNMIPASPFDFYIRRKLFVHNMGHALTSYFGYMKGYSYIWEAAHDTEIKLLALRALLESSMALSAEYGEPLKNLIAFSEDLIKRFENKLLGDTVARVGRDTKRKLSADDRLVGAANLCLKHGIVPVNICAGIAAALRFAPEGDVSSAEVNADLKANGIKHTLDTYCGIKEDSPLCAMICDIYGRLEKGEKLPDLISAMQKMK